ncbi:hypothetical protein FACS1894151_09700 [Spirochaetia bacterium]|nr:hypothetical protein FACS1894151_09700 [Spirochaetia bacterium]
MLVSEKNEDEAALYRRHTGMNVTLGNPDDYLARPDTRGCVKGLYIIDQGKMDIIRPRIEARFGSGVYITKSSPVFLEVLNGAASKGTGLQLAMDHLKLKAEQVIAFGDEENDLPMFSVAGFSAAPIDAKEEIRAAAGFSIGSCENDGLAEFLEKHFPENF